VLTGALSFDIFNKLIWTTQVTARGFQVYEATTRAVNLPRISNSIEAHYHEGYSPPQITTIISSVEDYSVFPEVLPHYWYPFISTTSANNGVYIQANTSGFDPLNWHKYILSVGYDTHLKSTSFAGQYVNSVWALPWGLSSQRSFQTFGTTTYQLKHDENSLSVFPDNFFTDKNFTLAVSLTHRRSNDDVFVTDHLGGSIQSTYTGFQQKVYQYYPLSGWGTFLKYRYLTPQQELGPFYGKYSQALASVLYYHSRWLPTDHALFWRLDGLHTFEEVSHARFGSSSSAYPLTSDDVTPQFSLRGYGSAQFFGNRMLSTTLEYRFPIKDILRGPGTDPLFFKTLTGAIVVDGLATDGYGETVTFSTKAQKFSESHWSAGAEARLNTTLGYFLPVRFILGYYSPFSSEYAKTGQVGLSLQMGGF
jgi:hypothetical protein